MWNRKNSNFLLIKIRIPSRFNFTIPLLLPVVEETLEELTDWMSLWTWMQVNNPKFPGFSAIRGLLQAGTEMFREIRALGPVDLDEVNNPEADVEIKLR
jgi:hypothetical protein